MDVEVEGTVNGLTSGSVDILQGGLLTGLVTGTQVLNDGGLLSGVTLTSAANVQNNGGLVDHATVQNGSLLTVGLPGRIQSDEAASLPAAEASGTVVLSGGSLQVLSGGSISGGTVSSGGFVYLSAGASASDATIADGGILIREGNTSVSGIQGTLAGLVVADRAGAVNQVFFQSGSATLSNITLDLNSNALNGGTVTVGYGETVKSLNINGSNTYLTFTIAGVVSGLTAEVDQTNLIAGGVLEGAVSKGSNSWALSIGNSGGTISGATLNSGVSLNNTSGEIDGLTVASGATLIAQDMRMTGLVVQSGGTLQIDSAANMGSAGGVLDVGATLAVGQNFSVTQSGGAVIVSSAGTVVQTYTLDTPDGSPVLLPTRNTSYGETTYLLAAGQIISGSQTSSGFVVSAGEVQIITSGGTSLETTVLSNGRQLVQSGGVASGTTVQSGGLAVLSAGASGVAAVVSANGSEFVSAGGSSIQADIKAGGYQTVASGGTAVSATVEQGARQDVSGGIASATQVSGYQYLAGGQTVSSVVASWGTEYVQTGTASVTRIQSAGQLVVNPSGSAVGAVVENGGSLTDTGGVVSGATVQSGGSLQMSGSVFSVWSNGYYVQSQAVGSACATTVLSGGMMQVGAGGRASGDVIASGGYVEVQSGGIISGETVQQGGLIILDQGGTVVGTNTSGVLAGVVVRDGSGSLISAIVQSGDNTVQSLDLTSLGGGAAYTVLVAAGETVSALSIGSSGQASTYNTLSIGGVVSGLAARNVGTTVLTGGTLEGDITLAGSAVNSWESITVVNQGGTVSGVTLHSGVQFSNQSGTVSDVTVQSGGLLELFTGTLQNGVVHSGGLLDLEGTSFNGGWSATVSDVTLDLGAHLRFASGLSGHIANDMLVLTSGGVTLESFAVNNLPPNAGGENLLLKEVTSGYQTYYELDDGTPCYCPGTLIATTRGEVAVEDLKIGDRVVTASGKRRPIRWIGNRAYSGRFAATNPDVLPVLFRTGSLGAGACGEPLPRRDLMVSPLHAMYLEGVLVPAQALVNGTSIVRLAQVDEVAYFHIELKTHDILLAEGAPAESFVDDDSRGMFHNAHEYARLYPTARPGAVQYCAPRVEEGPQLEAIRQKLNSLPVAYDASRLHAG